MVVTPRDRCSRAISAAHLDAQLGVQVGQRLVHQERPGLADDGPAHGDPLPLAAGQLAGLAVQQRLQLQGPRRVGHPPPDLVLRHLPVLEAERHVVVDAQVRVQGVALEHHGDVPVPGLEVVDRAAVDPDRPPGHLLQAGDHPQRRRLAAARRPDQHQQLAVADLQLQGLHGHGPVRELLADAVQLNARHGPLLSLAPPSPALAPPSPSRAQPIRPAHPAIPRTGTPAARWHRRWRSGKCGRPAAPPPARLRPCSPTRW